MLYFSNFHGSNSFLKLKTNLRCNCHFSIVKYDKSLVLHQSNVLDICDCSYTIYHMIFIPIILQIKNSNSKNSNILYRIE